MSGSKRRTRTGSAAGVFVLLMLHSALAAAFVVEIEEVVGGRDVHLQPASIGDRAIVRIFNTDEQPLRCELVFDFGPDEKARRVEVPPQSTRTVTVAVRRASTQRVRIRALCE